MKNKLKEGWTPRRTKHMHVTKHYVDENGKIKAIWAEKEEPRPITPPSLSNYVRMELRKRARENKLKENQE